MASFIRGMPAFGFYMLVVFGLAMGGVILAAAWHARKRARLLAETQTSNIGMASDGYGKFEGSVEAIGGETVVAPLTRSPCAWYHVKVEKWISRTSTQGSSYWSTIKETTSHTPFLLRDATGVCIVHPFRAEVTPSDRSRWTGAGVEPTDRDPQRLPPSESLTGMIEISGGPNSKYRYTEERVYDGQALFVLGELLHPRFAADAVEEDGEDDDEHADDEEDADGLGVEDEEESGEDAEDVEEASAAGFPDDWELADTLTTTAEATTRTIVSRGTGARPFIISTTPQAVHAMMQDMGSQAALYLALTFFAGIAFVLWIRLR